MSRKLVFALIALSGAALVVFLGVLYSSHGAGGPSFSLVPATDVPGSSKPEISPQATIVPPSNLRDAIRVATSVASRTATTWSARVVMRDDQKPVPGATLRVRLLSQDSGHEDLVLTTDGSGFAGTIDVDTQAHQGAEVRVDPGPSWAGTSRIVQFHDGQTHEDVLELAGLASLRIEVVDLHRQSPLPGAIVTLEGGGVVLAEVTCDELGMAVVPWVHAGEALQIQANFDSHVGVYWAEVSSSLQGDASLRLHLAREAQLRVRIVDEFGVSVPNSYVSAVLAQEAMGSRSSVPEIRFVAVTWEPEKSESGDFIFAQVPSEATLELKAYTQDGRAGRGFIAIDPTSRLGEATVIIEDAETVRFSTLDESGAPAPGTTILLADETLGVTDAEGVLITRLSPSNDGGELRAYKPGYALVWRSWHAREREVRFDLEPEMTLSGNVVDVRERPQGLVGVIPILGRMDEARQVRLRRGEILMRLTDKRTMRTSSSGAFVLRGLPPGALDVYVRPPKGGTFDVRQVEAGRQDLKIVLPTEESLGRDRGVGLSIRVTDTSSGAPISGADVTAFYASDPQQRSSRDGRMGKTGKDGNVRIASAQEGHYFIAVQADGYMPYYGPIVEYPIGEHAFEVQVQRASELVIEVVGKDGVAWQNYWVIALDSSGASMTFNHVEGGASLTRPELITDFEGRAYANRMPAGELILEVRARSGGAGPALIRKAIELIPGERVEVQLCGR